MSAQFMKWRRIKLRNIVLAKETVRKKGKALIPVINVRKKPTCQINCGAKKSKKTKQSSQETCPRIMLWGEYNPIEHYTEKSK
jgi:hypothetical protein